MAGPEEGYLPITLRVEMSLSRLILSLLTTDTLGQIIFCSGVGCCPMYDGMLIITPGLCPPHASSTFFAPIVKAKKFPDAARCPLEGKIIPVQNHWCTGPR